MDAGPINLFTLSPAAPAGNHAFGCRFLDPATGALLAEDLTLFKVE